MIIESRLKSKVKTGIFKPNHSSNLTPPKVAKKTKTAIWIPIAEYLA